MKYLQLQNWYENNSGFHSDKAASEGTGLGVRQMHDYRRFIRESCGLGFDVITIDTGGHCECHYQITNKHQDIICVDSYMLPCDDLVLDLISTRAKSMVTIETVNAIKSLNSKYWTDSDLCSVLGIERSAVTKRRCLLKKNGLEFHARGRAASREYIVTGYTAKKLTKKEVQAFKPTLTRSLLDLVFQ